MTVRRWNFRPDGTVGLKVETGVPPTCRVRLAREARLLHGFAAFAAERHMVARERYVDQMLGRKPVRPTPQSRVINRAPTPKEET